MAPKHLMKTYIVGSHYHVGAPEAVAKLKLKETLLLVRQPNNPYDRNAVAVHTLEGQMLGFIPRQDAPTVAAVIDKGVPYSVCCNQACSYGLEITW